MKALTEKIVHYVVLSIVTLFAAAVMWKLSVKEHLNEKKPELQVRALPTALAPKSPVVITPVQVETCEIISTHAGKIQPWETYKIGFPTMGRVIALGKNAAGQPLDDGDQVQAGQVLAFMDDRSLLAQRSEAAAQVEQATSDLQRVQRARKTSRAAFSDSELQQQVTNLALARARHEIVIKNLDDATLRAPVDAVISKRMIKSGESVNANQIVFELVENHEVLLIADVPETKIRELEERKRDLQNNSTDAVFRAYVRLEGRDRFGNPWPPLEGEVYRIPELADARTGLFAVEIRLANEQRLLRPGMVASVDIVTAVIPGYKIPETAVIFRKNRAYLFTIDRESTDMEMLYWDLGKTDLFRSRQIDLKQWIDQGEYVILPDNEANLSAVITRGQLRLADKQIVRIMNPTVLSSSTVTQITERPPSAAAER